MEKDGVAFDDARGAAEEVSVERAEGNAARPGEEESDGGGVRSHAAPHS